MKLVRRRTSRPAPAPSDGPAAPLAPAPPRGAVLAAYAEILDGVHLWAAVEEQPGAIGLRVVGSDDLVVDARPEAAGDQPGYRSAVLPLHDVTPDRAHEVVLVPDGGGRPSPVWAPGPATSATAPDGRSRLHLDRTDAGTLRVRREVLPESVPLRALTAETDALVLHLDAPALALQAGDGTILATVDTAADTARLTAESVAGTEPQQTRVLARGPAGWLPVARRANDLAEPGHGAPLPELRDPATGLPRLRLRWDAAGLLKARVLDGEDA